MGSFYAGLLHPVIEPGSALVIVATGLLLAQAYETRGARPLGAYLVAYPLALLTALWTGSIAWAGDILLVVSATGGLLVALAARSLHVLAAPAAVVAGVLVGLAAAPDDDLLRDRLLATLGTLVSGALGVVAITGYTFGATHQWQRIAMRIVGSWVAAASMLVLALALKRGAA
jgi:urease accessory protein